MRKKAAQQSCILNGLWIANANSALSQEAKGEHTCVCMLTHMHAGQQHPGQITLHHTFLPYLWHFFLSSAESFADKKETDKFGTLSGLWFFFFPTVLLTVWRSSSQNICAGLQQVGNNIGPLCRISLGFLLCVPSLLPQACRLCHMQKCGQEGACSSASLTCVLGHLGFPAWLRSSEVPKARFQKAFNF